MPPTPPWHARSTSRRYCPASTAVVSTTSLTSSTTPACRCCCCGGPNCCQPGTSSGYSSRSLPAPTASARSPPRPTTATSSASPRTGTLSSSSSTCSHHSPTGYPFRPSGHFPPSPSCPSATCPQHNADCSTR